MRVRMPQARNAHQPRRASKTTKIAAPASRIPPVTELDQISQAPTASRMEAAARTRRPADDKFGEKKDNFISDCYNTLGTPMADARTLIPSRIAALEDESPTAAWFSKTIRCAHRRAIPGFGAHGRASLVAAVLLVPAGSAAQRRRKGATLRAPTAPASSRKPSPVSSELRGPGCRPRLWVARELAEKLVENCDLT